ncbi:MAG: U4/U6-U5 snRNP complex subunit prp31 [Phylliscum demangeonii]|nr:MAG: U4/U6-U5 snRNP complex subunit prp31 [Phylliscum demangeonii]
MSTLADELLQDFEDTDSGGENEHVHDFLKHGDNEKTPRASEGRRRANYTDHIGGMELDDEHDGDEDVDEEMADGVAGEVKNGLEEDDNEDEAKAKVEKMQLGAVDDVRSVAGLMSSLEPVLEKIAYYQSLPPDKQQSTAVGSIEDNPEYHLLTQSNTLSTSIDNEIILVHKYIRDHYSVRFPELETLITNPLDYAKAVAIIGNGPMDDLRTQSTSSENLVGAPLRSVLDGPSLMVVTVEATTTRGRPLTDAELRRILRACEMTLQLDRAKKTLTGYVQSRMNAFAPNLTALIGSLTAAQLLNFAGGLTGLAKTPSCNIAPLGSKKQSQTGFATNVGVRHQGFLFHSPIIRGIPQDLKRQAMRIVSGKVTLAARIDRVHSSADGSLGEQLKAQCLERLEKLTEPAPNAGTRALPAPDDKPSRKRGGRRARKAKEGSAMTDLRKAQNRMAFGKEETEVGYGAGDATKGLGMIGQANEGRIRSLQVDQRTRAKLSKNHKGWGGATPLLGPGAGTASSLRAFGAGAGGGHATVLRAHGLRSSGIGGSGAGGGAGTASSLAFTPVQGLELVDPKVQAEIARKRKAEDDGWFKGGTFTMVGGGAGPSTTVKDRDGFVIPALPPPRKKVDLGVGKPASFERRPSPPPPQQQQQKPGP